MSIKRKLQRNTKKKTKKARPTKAETKVVGKYTLKRGKVYRDKDGRERVDTEIARAADLETGAPAADASAAASETPAPSGDTPTPARRR